MLLYIIYCIISYIIQENLYINLIFIYQVKFLQYLVCYMYYIVSYI